MRDKKVKELKTMWFDDWKLPMNEAVIRGALILSKDQGIDTVISIKLKLGSEKSERVQAKKEILDKYKKRGYKEVKNLNHNGWTVHT